MQIINLIFGASGFAKEVEWLIQDVFDFDNSINFKTNYFVTSNEDSLIGFRINNILVISESEAIYKYANSNDYFVNAFICVGNPMMKEKIYNKICSFKNFIFPSIIHPSVNYDRRYDNVVINEGVIICSNSILTTNIKIGSFVHINLNCTIGHDCKIEKFSTISPGVNISGKVKINKNVFIGTNSTLLENIFVESNVIIGAGAVVTNDLNEIGTYIGMPAKKIK